MKKISAMTALVLALCLVAGGVHSGELKGSLKIAGSTTVLPISQMWAEAFMARNPGVSVMVSGGGTGVGISGLLNGNCVIANASRAAKAKEIETARSRNSKLVGTKIARDGLAIVVHPSNNVKNLTMAQIAGIYKGSIQNWKEVGGDESDEIVVVGRDTASGTYGFFQEVVLGNGPYKSGMLSMASNAAVAQAVAQSKNAIGYVSMAFADKAAKEGKVRILSVSKKSGAPGVKPTEESVRDGSYPLTRFLYVYTLGSPRGLAAEFIKFGLSEEGQKLVRKADYVPL
jgi:phosphate transport system substrate-binding protein